MDLLVLTYVAGEFVSANTTYPHINAVLVYIPEQNKRRVCKYERNMNDTFALAVVQTNCLSLVAVTLKGVFEHSNHHVTTIWQILTG
jgi:NAD-dependent oxidoreductase involved in siderophore biosynthesis